MGHAQPPVPPRPVHQRPPQHAGLEEGEQGENGDEAGVDRHEDVEGEGGGHERLDGPAEAAHNEGEEAEREEDPGEDQDGEHHHDAGEDVRPEVAGEGRQRVAVLVAGGAALGPAAEGLAEPLPAAVARIIVGPMPRAVLMLRRRRRRSAGRVVIASLLAVEHVGENVAQELLSVGVTIVLSVSAARGVAAATYSVFAARRVAHFGEEIADDLGHARVQVPAAVVAGVVPGPLARSLVGRAHN